MPGIINNDSELENAIGGGGGIAALFYSAGCPFCIRFLPVFEKYSEPGPEKFLRVLIDGMPSSEEKYAIQVVPTVIFFKDGAVKRRLDGIRGVGLNEADLTVFLKDCGWQ
ncbi:MAG: thioredoxin family protein [Elusimicrobia bacterium]|nr:thioredoxin family protein [Elusimicrobiota bacterium]